MFFKPKAISALILVTALRAGGADQPDPNRDSHSVQASRGAINDSAAGVAAFNVRTFGAIGDGVHLDTTSLQAAIDACNRSGGGTVFVPAGRYTTGMLRLRSNVTLHLAPAAELLGSTDLADYATDIERCGFVTETAIDKCLIYAQDAENIMLTGQGVIDGRGAAFPMTTPDGKRGERPMLMRFARCRNVCLDGLTLKNAGSWCSHFLLCSNVRVHGVTILSRASHNNDGIDLMSTENVRISDCTILCEDDAICFQDMSDEHAVRDITITNCVMSTRWAAIRSGGAHRGGIRNVTVSNCVIYDTFGCGIKLQISGRGTLEDMTFSNIVMKNVSSPISLRFGNHHYNNEKPAEPSSLGGLRNILFSNIRATVIDEAGLKKAVPTLNPGEERQCISICGIPGHPVENVMLSDVHITFPGGGTAKDAAVRDLPEMENQYPEYFMWGVLPAYGLYARHAKGIVLDNVRFDLAGSDLRPAVVCDDVEDLEVAGFRAAGSAQAESLLRLRGVRQAFIHGCRPLNETGTFVRVEGSTSREITLSGNDLRRVRAAVAASDEVNRDAVENAEHENRR